MSKQGAWEQYGGGRRPIINCHTRLEAGVYYAWESSQGIIFSPSKQFNDPVLDLPGLPNEFIKDQIDKFWKNEALYQEHGFVHKRGILLYGPPGNGKSSVIAALIRKLIAEDGVVVTVSSYRVVSQGLQQLKQIEPNRKLMVLMEDMDTLLSGDAKGEEPYALSLLDGQAQVNGVVYVGTTNYPELLADRFIRRPGRFDLIIGMGNPIAITRKAYLNHILSKVSEEVVEMIVEKTEGLSLSYLREIASSYLCLGVPIEESVSRLKTAASSKYKGGKLNTGSVGFTIGYSEESRGASVGMSAEQPKTEPAPPGVYTTAVAPPPNVGRVVKGFVYPKSTKPVGEEEEVEEGLRGL